MRHPVNPEIIENKAFMPKLGFSKKKSKQKNKDNLWEMTISAKLKIRWLEIIILSFKK